MIRQDYQIKDWKTMDLVTISPTPAVYYWFILIQIVMQAGFWYMADKEAGYEYPDLYRHLFGVDYVPPPHIEAAYKYARKHKWYGAARAVTVNVDWLSNSTEAAFIDQLYEEPLKAPITPDDSATDVPCQPTPFQYSKGCGPLVSSMVSWTTLN